MWRYLRRKWRNQKGQALVLVTVFLGGLLGMAALAIDMGNLYVAKASLQKAADAAVLAGGSGLVIDQATATARATNIGNQNIAAHNTVSGAALTVTFPAASTIRVTAAHPAVALFLGGIAGFNSAPVSATASATVAPVGGAPGLVPLAIYCNSPGGCGPGNLPLSTPATPNPMTLNRYCGNFFMGGPGGSACGNNVAPNEVFLQGVTITQQSNSNAVFREEVYSGYNGDVNMGDQVGALPGNRNGWKSGMINRLAEGRNEMTLAVIQPIGAGLDMEVVDFVRVRVNNFNVGNGNNTDTTTLEIIEHICSTCPTGTPGQGLGSIVKVQLTE
jgi:Flp pilus assembly protein TadG